MPISAPPSYLSLRTEAELEGLIPTLYGSLWVGYDDAQWEQSIELFGERLARNGFDLGWFRGKDCLDAGCGGGRYTVAMARLGARQAVGVDLGEVGLADAAKRAQAEPGDNITFRRASVLDLRFEDASFDFVCCNGVLHHTTDPERGLAEIWRVLRPGGYLWLYVYGQGGVQWEMVDLVRILLQPVPPEETHAVLSLLGVPANRRFDFMDPAYVPIQLRYAATEVEAWLTRQGFTDIQRLMAGVAYDTNARLAAGGEAARTIWGEGELRYLARKAEGAPIPSRVPTDDVSVPASPIAPLLEEVAAAFAQANPKGRAQTLRVVTACRMYRCLRDWMENQSDLDVLYTHLRDLADHAKACLNSEIRICGVEP